MRYYAIFDRKADSEQAMFGSPNHATAMREVSDGLRQNQMLASHAADFELVYRGEVGEDRKFRLAQADGRPEFVCEVSDLVSEQP